MRDRVVRALAAVVLAASGILHAQSQNDHDHQLASTRDQLPIVIVINPEARVSVSWRGKLPSTGACGHAVEIPVIVVNRGFVTTSLEVILMDPAGGIDLNFSAEPLTGIYEERRALLVTLKESMLLDITIAFRAKNGLPDAEGNDQIHFLIGCTT